MSAVSDADDSVVTIARDEVEEVVSDLGNALTELMDAVNVSHVGAEVSAEEWVSVVAKVRRSQRKLEQALRGAA